VYCLLPKVVFETLPYLSSPTIRALPLQRRTGSVSWRGWQVSDLLNRDLLNRDLLNRDLMNRWQVLDLMNRYGEDVADKQSQKNSELNTILKLENNRRLPLNHKP
jgi:hypothetical protein